MTAAEPYTGPRTGDWDPRLVQAAWRDRLAAVALTDEFPRLQSPAPSSACPVAAAGPAPQAGRSRARAEAALACSAVALLLGGLGFLPWNTPGGESAAFAYWGLAAAALAVAVGASCRRREHAGRK